MNKKHPLLFLLLLGFSTKSIVSADPGAKKTAYILTHDADAARTLTPCNNARLYMHARTLISG